MKQKSLKNFTVTNIPWFEVEKGKDAGKVKVPTLKFMKFLGDLGYRYAFINGIYQIIWLVNNIVFTVVDKSEIISTIRQWLVKNSVNSMIDGIYIEQIESAWINKTSQLFNQLNLKFLPTIEITPHFDTENSCFLYFKNTAVKINKNDYKLIDYKDIEGFVFSEQIIHRDFYPFKINKCFRRTNFAKFIYNISDGNMERIKAFLSLIGYLLYS